MNHETAFRTFRPIPRKVIRRLAADGIITFPLSASDHQVMVALCRIWTNEWYVAQMNKLFDLDKRAMMLAFPNFGKIERYILSCYLNLKPEEKISVKKMASWIRKFFELEYSEGDIERIRQIAYNLRRPSREATRNQLIIQLAMLQEVHDCEEQKRRSNFPDKQTFPNKEDIEKFVLRSNPPQPRKRGENNANR
jgi:hypothetical protein